MRLISSFLYIELFDYLPMGFTYPLSLQLSVSAKNSFHVLQLLLMLNLYFWYELSPCFFSVFVTKFHPFFFSLTESLLRFTVSFIPVACPLLNVIIFIVSLTMSHCWARTSASESVLLRVIMMSEPFASSATRHSCFFKNNIPLFTVLAGANI